MRYYRLVKNNTYKINIVNSQIDNSIRITESSGHTQIREEKCHWMITVLILFQRLIKSQAWKPILFARWIPGKRQFSVVRRRNSDENLPSLFMLSTDGFANSSRNEDEFVKTCADYYKFWGTFEKLSQKFSFYFGRIGGNILKKEI